MLPKLIQLLDLTIHDGSRQFVALPESVPWNVMREHIASLEGTSVTAYLTDKITEVWIDFSYCGHKFTLNNQYGEYWFFVKDHDCPENLLQTVATHCAALTGI